MCLLFTLLLLALLSNIPFQVGAACTLCTNNETPTNVENGVMTEGLTCKQAQQILNQVDIPETADHCYDMQKEAFKACGCPTFPEDVFCALCDGGAHQLEPPSKEFDIIPLDTLPTDLDGDGTDDFILCVDALFHKRSSGLCTDLKRADHFCGCPNARTPICHAACKPPSFTPETARGMLDPDAPAKSGDRLLPPHFSRSCQDMYTQSQFYWTQVECYEFQNPSYSLIDVMAYCCSDDVPTQPVSVCDLCSGFGNGQVTHPHRLVTVAGNDNSPDTRIQMSCQDLQTLSFAVEDQSYCESVIQQTDYVEACCLGLSDPPSLAPTRPPTDPPTTTPSPPPTILPFTRPSDKAKAIGNDEQSSSGMPQFTLLIAATAIAVVVDLFMEL